MTETSSNPHRKAHYFGDEITLHCNGVGKGDTEILWTWHFVPLHKRYKNLQDGDKGFDYSLSKDKTTLKIFNLRKVFTSFIECFITNEVGIRGAAKYYLVSNPRPIIPSKCKSIFQSLILCLPFVGICT